MADTFYDFISAAASSSVGAILGTAVKFVRHPPASFGMGFAEAFFRISVGTFAGGTASEWGGWGPWVSASAAAAGAYIADEILRAIERNSQRLEHIEPPIPFEKEHPHEDV